MHRFVISICYRKLHQICTINNFAYGGDIIIFRPFDLFIDISMKPVASRRVRQVHMKIQQFQEHPRNLPNASRTVSARIQAYLTHAS